MTMQLIFQLGTMYCIQCGATPTRLGNWCQSCVNASASIPSTSPAEVIQPPIAQAESKSANEILRLKRQQAIQQALLRQASPNPNPVTQSPLAQNSVIANSQALMEQVSASGSQGAAYESACLSRMKPYNHPQMVKGTKTPKGRTGKGIISSVATPQKILVPCLQKSGSSNPEKSDPILDDDVSNSSLPLGDFSYYPEVKNTTKNNEHPVDKRKNSKVMIKNDTSRSTSKPTKLKEDEIVVVPHPNMMELDDGLVFIRITPPWISNPILDPDDLSWDRFGTLENSLSLRGDDSNWVDGVRYELNLDGLNTTQRICLYPVDYQNCLKLKSTSKIISAEILNSGSVFPMPNCSMRAYALARKFVAQFCQAIKSSECATKLKQLAKKIWVSLNQFSIMSFILLSQIPFNRLLMPSLFIMTLKITLDLTRNSSLDRMRICYHIELVHLVPYMIQLSN
ncbi:hypothetical protein MJO28_016021 [Puccinia striiformis f. sp. tritici]|uniref:Uncharacterized protein n=1 Tax=Puccinia striiformis f. sp. tritici TaxID=168172 RepID=A0ACC0DRG7_9BASI|nr:hypothetical protein MJO28_016021 [Puccinia striiformis f. sp. tritici]